MAAEKATHLVNRRKISVFVKTTLVALGLIAAGSGAVIVVENMGQSVHAVATAARQSFAATSSNGANTPDKRMSTDDFLSSNLNDKINSPVSGPRECRPEQGIVSDCTFQ